MALVATVPDVTSMEGTLNRTASLVESDQKDSSLGRGGVVSDCFGALAVVIENPDPYPPVPGGAAESQHPGCAVTVAEAVDQPVGGVLVVKRADLHRPTSAGVQGDRSLEHFDPNQGDTRLPHVNLLRRRQGQIEDAAGNEWSPVGDAYQTPRGRS